MTVAAYARVSRFDQEPENQLVELRRYVAARGWTATEFVDHGVSGAKARRPALDRLLADVRRRKVDLIVIWSLDRLGRSLRQLVELLDEFHALGIGFVSLREGLDFTTPAGRLQWQIIAAISEFERARLVERVHAGLARARSQAKRLGRPPKPLTPFQIDSVAHLSVREAARKLGVSKSVLWAARQEVSGKSSEAGV